MGTLIIKAKDLAGRPVSGLRVHLSYPGGTPYVSHTTDGEGELRFMLTARDYVVRSDESACFEWDRAPHRVRVREDGITRVVYTLPVEDFGGERQPLAG